MKYKPWTFYITTFGCKVNQYESQAIREAWISFQGEETFLAQKADVTLINTCAVTEHTVSNIRRLINKLAREAPTTKIIVTGCALGLSSENIQNLTGVHVFIEQKNKAQLLLHPLTDQICNHSPQKNNFLPFSITSYYRSRPTIKIQDGCSQKCTFCIIPITRGAPQSRSPKECLSEIENLFKAGFREIILSGINLLQYRTKDDGCNDFWDLVKFLDKKLSPHWNGIARLRISSLDPAQCTQKALDVLEQSTMMCPQLHISIQSGSPNILKVMHRSPYTPEALIEIFQKLSSIWPTFGLGADLLVGFPGETEEHLQQTIDLVKALPLTYAHIFPFSARPGTVAEKLPNHVEHDEKHTRAQRLRNLISIKKQAFQQHILSLPLLHVAPEPTSQNRGTDEYYNACIFSKPTHNTSYDIVKVRPLSLVENKILVENYNS